MPSKKTVKVTCDVKDRLPLDSLEPLQGELKWLEEKQYEKLKASLLRHGFVFPEYVWKSGKTNYVCDGHQRIRALYKMRDDDGIEVEGGNVPVVYVRAKDKKHAMELILAATSQYGRLDEDSVYRFVKENGLDWDDAIKPFAEFPSLNMGKLEVGWFSDKLHDGSVDDDDVPEAPKQPVAKRGDIWELGDHRLYCANAGDSIIKPKTIDCVFTSPPYNMGVSYDHGKDTGTWQSYEAKLRPVVSAMYAALKFGRAICWNIGVSPKTYVFEQGLMLKEIGFSLQRQIVWKKSGVPIPSFHTTRDNSRVRHFTPNYAHELVLIFSKGPLEHGSQTSFDNTLRDDVFTIHQATSTVDVPTGAPYSGSANLDRRSLKAHPAVFPTSMVCAFARHFIGRGELMLDPFAGSGTVFIAAERASFRAVGIELSPNYCDVAIERWQNITGNKAKRQKKGSGR